MSYDDECRKLARYFLRDYRLTVAEQDQEERRLTEAIRQAIEIELEALAERKAVIRDCTEAERRTLEANICPDCHAYKPFLAGKTPSSWAVRI